MKTDFTEIKYDLPLTTGVPAMSPDRFAKPYSGRRPQIFFLNSVGSGREIVELIERMDAEWENVSYDRNWDTNKWGFGDFYDLRAGIWDFDLIHRNMEIMLCSDRHFDVMVIPCKNGWGEFSRKARRAILRRVKEGCGLVLIHPFDGRRNEKSEELRLLSPLESLYEEGFNERGYPEYGAEALKTSRWVAQPHYITNGIPIESMPTELFPYYPYKAAGGVILRAEDGAPIAAVKEYEGRVAGLGAGVSVGTGANTGVGTIASVSVGTIVGADNKPDMGTAAGGRVVAFGWQERDILPKCAQTDETGCFLATTETWTRPIDRVGYDYTNYLYRLLGRAILWAGRCEAPGFLSCRAQPDITGRNPFIVETSKDTGGVNADEEGVNFFGGADADEAGANSFGGANADKSNDNVRCNAKIYVRVKNSFDKVIVTKREYDAGFVLPDEVHFGGEFRAEFSLEDENGVIDFYTLPFGGPPHVVIDEISLREAVLTEGAVLHGKARVYGRPDRVAVRLYDGYDRLLAETSATLTSTYPISATADTDQATAAPAAYAYQAHATSTDQAMPATADTDQSTTAPAATKYGEVNFSFNINGALSGFCYVTLEAEIAGATVSRKKSETVVITCADRDLRDFEALLSPINKGHGDLAKYVNPLFEGLGLTGIFVGDRRVMAPSGGGGLGVYWYHRAEYVKNKEKYLRTRDKKYLTRVPCLNDPEFWRKNREAVAETVSRNKVYGPISYYAQDEGSLTCYTDELELCFCPYCMEKMRLWLRTIYGSLDELNKSWNTRFRDWGEAVPYTTREARDTGDYASWGDHRRFMELTYAGAYANFKDMITAADGLGRVRMSGCQSTTAYSGNDYDLLHQHVRYFEAYGGIQYEYHRSFKKPETILGGWFGYGADGEGVRARIWDAVFHGLTLISVFWEASTLNPDFTYSRSAVDMGLAFREIRREGIGKLLLYAAEQDTLGIAIHYSPASFHAASITGMAAFHADNLEGWRKILENMGYQYRFISTRQIEKGGLKQVKLLILPYSLAIGAEEAILIEDFVRCGGCVVGDAQTGMFDGHCKRGDGHGRLDGLFGIERLTPYMEKFYINNELMFNGKFPYFEHPDMLIGLELAEAGVRVCGGVGGGADNGVGGGVVSSSGADGGVGGGDIGAINAYRDDFSSNVAGVTVHETGAGKTVYLNFTMHEYERKFGSVAGSGATGGSGATEGGALLRGLMNKIIATCGVEKPAQILDADGAPMELGLESFYYKLGESSLICVERDPNADAVLNYDGILKSEHATDDSREAREKPSVIALKTAAHVYDVRRKRYIGETDSICCEFSGGANVFALLEYKAEDLILQADSAKGVICAELTISGKPPEKTVFAVNVRRPDGEYSTLYSQNIIADGTSFEYKIPFALNDPAGEWQVNVKEVATGLERSVKIKPANAS